jgi:hypothetical protein
MQPKPNQKNSVYSVLPRREAGPLQKGSALPGVGTVSRIQAIPTALFNGQTPLGMSNTKKLARALPRLENMALKVVKMGT